MHYNLRVTVYPNGDMQARSYSTLMHKEDKTKEQIQQENERKGRNGERNPFDGIGTLIGQSKLCLIMRVQISGSGLSHSHFLEKK